MLRTPTLWSAIFKLRIVDPDGWRVNGVMKDFDMPLSEKDFLSRMSVSTCQFSEGSIELVNERIKQYDF
jgi:hypothetical protein